VAIKFHCSLEWGGDGSQKGSSQFQIPYFLFHPLRGQLVMVDSWKYRTDDDEIAAMQNVFNAILMTGEITFPIPAEQTRAVAALQQANLSRGKVTILIGLLQYNQGRSQPLHVATKLVNAGVSSLFQRQMQLIDEVTGTVTNKLYYVTSFKGTPVKNLKTLVAPA
jgi:hypothetical protein